MDLHRVRRALWGADRDASDPRVLERMTVGVFTAWIAMGGDLLGSCVYGPDVLGRSSVGNRSILVVAAAATLATLALLALAYTRMVARFPHGGGGYTAAKAVVHRRLALVSGVALVFDAGFNVAVSVVACVEAVAAVLPVGGGAVRLPAAILLIVVLAGLNLRGVKESVAVLVPILLAFVLSHLVVLGLGIAARAGELPGVIAPVWRDLQGMASQRGVLGTLATAGRAYALGGAIYTGLESISNGVPILREPKVRSARRTMVLLAGVPAVIIAAIVAGYLLYGVRPAGDQPMNAILFQQVAGRLGPGLAARAAVAVPLLAEAALLVMAAQTGFVDGPHILGALATDRYLPKRLSRLNGRLAPAPGILVITGVALAATVLTGARLEPLIAVFVVSVFVTFTVSQWAMLRHALRRAEARWWADAGLHAVALALCAVILAGSIANWKAGSAVALALIGATVLLAVAIRRRYDSIGRAVEQIGEDAVPPVVPPERQARVLPPERLVGGDAPIAVLVVGDRTAFARVALSWLARLPGRIGGVILASVSVLDAEAVQGDERLRELEEARRRELQGVAEDVRRSGLPVAVELRRGADVLETAAALVTDLTRRRSGPSIVIGFRATPEGSGLDPLLRDDLAVRLQARLQRDGIPMLVASIPLEA